MTKTPQELEALKVAQDFISEKQAEAKEVKHAFSPGAKVKWRSGETDIPSTILKCLGALSGGEPYYSIKHNKDGYVSPGGVPESALIIDAVPTRPNMLKAALRHAARSWHVFPCHVPIFNDDGACVGCTCEEWKRTQARFGPDYKCPQPGKCPAVRWSEKSTDDKAQIKKWWIRKWKSVDVETGAIVYFYPNIAVDCGKSGLIVLDEDKYKEVYGDLGDLLSPDEQETVKQLSGSHQGSHLLYAMPEGKAYGNETGELPDGLDVRGVGGYIVAEPSLHKSGNRYEWIEGYGPDEMNLQTLPEPLQTILDAAQENNTKNKAVTFTEATTEAPDMAQWHISKEIRQLIDKAPAIGERSEADYKVCLSLCYAGATDDDILAVFEHNPVGKDGKFAESGKRYLSLTISKARAYMDEHPRTTTTEAQAVEEVVTFAIIMDEIQALDAASSAGKVDRSELMKYLLHNAARCDKLPALDDAMLRVELQQRKITKAWIDGDWESVKGQARKTAEAAKPDAPELPQKIKTWPYDVQGGCIGIWKVFKNDTTGEEEEVFSSLCNFDVRIVADVAADDGEETSRKIAIAGTLDTGLPLPEIEIDADEFEFMKWPVAKWGSRVSIEPFKGAANLLRHAIQKLSADTMTDRRTFTHTGWRVIDGKRVFLDADGAIGADGVNVKLPQNLKNYVFPRDNAVSAKDAMRASVDLLDIAPAKVSAPLYAAIFSAPLSEIIPSVFTPSMNGGSGSLKSSLGAVHLNHFGAKFTEYAMPADWLATANSLEKLTFHAKDIPLIIDDFRPSTNPAESRMLQEAVSRITRAVGNRQGRSRLDANSEFKRTYAPRGVVMMTAERNATGKSTTSRILTIDVEPGDISSSLLTVAQKQRHVYQYAMRGYIESIARDYDELAKMLPARVAELRTRNDNGHHKRLPNATAILYAGFECAMSYAVEIEAITPAEAKRRCNDCYQALQSIEQIQSESTEAEDPAIKYVTILASLIAQDKAYLVGKGKNLSNLGMSSSEKLGWYDTENVYLLPGAYNAVCRYATVEGWSFPSDENTLRKELDRQQWLTKHDPNRHTTAARPPGSKSIERVTVIDRAKFAGVLLDMGVEFPPPVTP